MVWRIEGHSLASREYQNTQQIVDEVLAPFAGRFVDGERFRPVRVRSIRADGGTVIVVWDGHGVANDGQPYDNSYAWVMQLLDGEAIDAQRSTTASLSPISGNASNPADAWSRFRVTASARADVVYTPAGDEQRSARSGRRLNGARSVSASAGMRAVAPKQGRAADRSWSRSSPRARPVIHPRRDAFARRVHKVLEVS
jgi:hypothetical protein